MVDCHLIHLSFGIVVHLLSAASFLFPLQNSYIVAPWNAGSPPAGKLAQVSILVPDQLEVPCTPRIQEDEIGMGAIQTPWPLMRHEVRVKESKELKVAEERNLKCSRSTSTSLRMISGESETSCPGRRAICARRTRQIKKQMTRLYELNQQTSK